MRLTHRVRRLESLEALAHPPSVMDRLQRALSEAAIRLTGKEADQIRGASDLDLVCSDLEGSFIGKLGDGELEVLITDMERAALGSGGAGLRA